MAIVVHLVNTYLTRIQSDYDYYLILLEIGAGGAIYLHTWYYTTLLGQHRRKCQLFRDYLNINQIFWSRFILVHHECEHLIL